MFKYYIPIGWYCGTAASLSKYGLRSFSGPFDWYFSNLSGVIYFLENDFADFLHKDNLSGVEGKPSEFKDIVHGLHFNHDITNSLEEDYEDICEKYKRRIEKFRVAAKQGVCFLRAVRDNEELDYIAQEEAHIQCVIKSYNPANEIIYLIPQYLDIPPALQSRYFTLKFSCYQGMLPGSLRTLFDTNDELITFLTENCDKEMQKDNLIFDLRAELAKAQKASSAVEIERIGMENVEIAYQEVRMNEAKCKLLLKLARTDVSQLDLPSVVDIYGADEIGKLFYDMIKTRCTVECFIDSHSKETSYDGIPIMKPESYSVDDNKKIVIIPSYPCYALDGISSSLKPSFSASDSQIILLEGLLN